MENIRYSIHGGLSSEQLDRMHEAALRVLDEVGLEVAFPEILRAVAGQTGVRVKGQNVRLDPERVQTFVEEYRDGRHGEGGDPDAFIIDILSGYAFQIVDLDTDALRPMSTSDCIEMAKLVDGLSDEGVVGGTPGMPQDVPPALREVMAYRIGCEHSRTSGDVGMTSLQTAEVIYRMAEVCGKPFGLPVFTLDPLRVAGDGVAIALDFIQRGRTMALGFSSMPLLGLTCPIHLPGAFVENIATVLGAFSLFKIMGVPNPLRYHFDVYPFDMKWGSVAYGTPEHILMHLMGSQVNRYYGAYSDVCKPFHTNAMAPDAHSMVQRASFAAAACLDGARRFTFGGMLGIDKVFSAEQLLIDVAIVRHVQALAKGVEFSPERLALSAIRDVGPGGTFITHPSTLAHHREISSSDLFENISPETWASGARTSLRDRIREKVRKIIAGHDFVLEEDKKKELDKLVRTLKNW